MSVKLKKKGLTSYLNYYNELQEDILLVYHPSENSYWNDRVLYLGENYSNHKRYNHRTVLKCEVVFEYDIKDKNTLNEGYANIIYQRLINDGLKPSMWFSGGKSFHIHVLLDIVEYENLYRLKQEFMKYYTKGLPSPDLQVCADNHLIRAEGGIHEKTMNYKMLVKEHPEYPSLSKVKQEIFDVYEEKLAYLDSLPPMDLSYLEQTEEVKMIMNAEEFKKYNDGRDRAMVLLIHILKDKLEKPQVEEYLCDWYKRTGGYKLDRKGIRAKIDSNWAKNYSYSMNYVNNLLVEIGAK